MSDAARSLEAVLMTGARMLAADASVSVATIAAEAGVDRRTVYRTFGSRDDFLAAIYLARLEAVERAIEDARLREAPVAVALHRYVENIIAVNRTWPVDLARMPAAGEDVRERRDATRREVEMFLRRAVDEGVIRSELPPGWAGPLLPEMINLVSRQQAHLDAAEAADIVVDTLLKGIGRQCWHPEHRR
jgi:AcrR family transcriptional regulator